MKPDRLDLAQNVIVDRVEQLAADRGLDVTQASNHAYDTAIQDNELVALCKAHQKISDAETCVRPERSWSDPVYDPTLSAGLRIEEAISARVDELVDEIVQQRRDIEIQEATA